MNNTQRKLIIRYLKAFANLYGIIPIKEAQNMLDEYEDKRLSIKIFLGGRDITDPDKYGLITEDGLIIHDDVIFLDDGFFEELTEAQKGKSYARLPKDEILKYEAPDYYENTPQFRNMVTFLHFALQITAQEATEIAENVAYMCKAEMQPDQIFEELEREGITFANTDQYNQFLQKYTDMANNTRLWANCGHTPSELRKIMLT
ncbi:MAG: hypothetical protein IJ168_05190 [Eubacterium sp.]|nr:hypothetical protein [Eubacterium sp.]